MKDPKSLREKSYFGEGSIQENDEKQGMIEETSPAILEHSAEDEEE